MNTSGTSVTPRRLLHFIAPSTISFTCSDTRMSSREWGIFPGLRVDSLQTASKIFLFGFDSFSCFRDLEEMYVSLKTERYVQDYYLLQILQGRFKPINVEKIIEQLCLLHS